VTTPEHAWPALDFDAWAPTKRSLHLYAQMLGKMRLALSPLQPNWMFTSLALTARGITTGPMPWDDASVQGSIDVLSSEIVIDVSDGRSRRIALVPARTIADVWRELRAAWSDLGITAPLTNVPQELRDTTPFDRDLTTPAYDPAAAWRWFAVATATATTFDEWRAHFFGRTGIQLWWGAFDLALLLFSGRHVPAPLDRGYLIRYDLDAEMMNAGFYPGDEANPRPMFYGYIYPQPENCKGITLGHPDAFWSEQLGEWLLPYDAVRTAADPRASLRAFLDAIYLVCGSAAGWDRAAHTYAQPKVARPRPA